MATRQYEFIVGPETSALPTVGTPSDDDDLLTLGYAEDHYGVTVTNTYASPYGAIAGTSIPITAELGDQTKYVAGSGGVVMSANPQIAFGTRNGQRLTLVGTHDTNFVQVKDGNGLDLNGDMILFAKCRLELEFDDDASLWRERNRRG